MSTDVPFLELLLLKNMLPARLDYITRLDEYYFKDNPEKPISTDSIEGLDGLEVCEVVITKDTVFREHFRAKTLGSISMKLIFNNPFCSPELILKEVMRLNDCYSEDPHPLKNPKPNYNEVRNIVMNNYQKFITGELNFSRVIRKNDKTKAVSKKYVFRSLQFESTDPIVKRFEGIKTYAEGRRAKNLRRYAEAINCLQDCKKITQKRIAEFMGMSPRNLRRYRKDEIHGDFFEKYDEVVKKYNAMIKNGENQ